MYSCENQNERKRFKQSYNEWIDYTAFVKYGSVFHRVGRVYIKLRR